MTNRGQHIYETEVTIRMTVHVRGTLADFEDASLTKQAFEDAIEMAVVERMPAEAGMRIDTHSILNRFYRPRDPHKPGVPDLTLDYGEVARHIKREVA